MRGKRETPPRNGNMRPSKSLINRRVPRIPHKQKGRSDCNNYREVSLVAHSGKVLLRMDTHRLGNHCEAWGKLPEEQLGVRPARSTVDLQFVVCRLQELGRVWKIPLHMWVIPPERV